MDATNRFKRLVIVILVCSRHRSHDRLPGAQKPSGSGIGARWRLLLLARPCLPFCNLHASAWNGPKPVRREGLRRREARRAGCDAQADCRGQRARLLKAPASALACSVPLAVSLLRSIVCFGDDVAGWRLPWCKDGAFW
jgi:hypothetical protein